MFRDELLNLWVAEQPTGYFLPLGRVKLLKLADFLSSYDTFKFMFSFCREKISSKEEFQRASESYKIKREKYHLNYFKKDLQEACRHYTYFKKIIDAYESCPWKDMDFWESISDTEKMSKILLNPQNVKKAKKAKKKKENKSIPSNVVNFEDYKKKSA